ncbi:hypothetical protein EB796_003606 [Bugula neritina]|uniref:Uncharacterized protein n=1 Tax=Bugula neritina TaxID=10212 RepID=A0A7J7KHD6_BUGNE|nr:hypothetical protein EB796_003606 [Bugula neritina]
MAAYRWVSQKKLDEIVNRLQRKTVAYVASNSWVDNQDYHVANIRQKDAKALKASSLRGSNDSLEKITGRVSRPTTASHAARYDFDAQKCHIDYLKKTLPKYNPERKRASSIDEVIAIGEKLSKETAASKAARYDFDAQHEHVKYLERTDEKYPGNKKYGFRCKSAPFKKVTSDSEIEDLNYRLTKPTVASDGGKSLQNKEFVYIIPKQTKTNIPIKVLRYRPVTRRANSLQEVIEIGEKLSKETAASKAAKYDFDAQWEHVKYLEKMDEKYPGNKNYGFRRKTAPFRSLTNDGELEELNKRLTKPTVASGGGKTLKDKKFEYMPPKQTKTCIILDGADTKYKGFKRLSPEQLNASAERLSTQPKRY